MRCVGGFLWSHCDVKAVKKKRGEGGHVRTEVLKHDGMRRVVMLTMSSNPFSHFHPHLTDTSSSGLWEFGFICRDVTRGDNFLPPKCFFFFFF